MMSRTLFVFDMFENLSRAYLVLVEVPRIMGDCHVRWAKEGWSFFPYVATVLLT